MGRSNRSAGGLATIQVPLLSSFSSWPADQPGVAEVGAQAGRLVARASGPPSRGRSRSAAGTRRSRRLPGGEDQLVGLHGAAREDRGPRKRAEREVPLELAQALAERPVEHDAHRALGAVGRHEDRRPAGNWGRAARGGRAGAIPRATSLALWMLSRMGSPGASELLDLDAGVRHQALDQGVVVVVAPEPDLRDPGRGEHLGAVEAGVVGHVGDAARRPGCRAGRRRRRRSARRGPSPARGRRARGRRGASREGTRCSPRPRGGSSGRRRRRSRTRHAAARSWSASR